MRARALLALSLAFVVACKGSTTSDPPHALASPQASAVPAPLANIPTTSTSATAVAASGDAGPVPQVMRPDQGLPPDTLSRDVAGYTLQALLRAGDVAPPAKGAEVSGAGMEAARKKTEPRITIDLAPGRARLVLSSSGFVLPAETELRARSDRYGYLVLLPNASTYRIAAPGALRGVLGERRLDVAPLSVAEVSTQGEGARRLGYRTRKVEAATRAARASFEIARVADAGEGGALLCRVLLDLINAPPSTPLCQSDEVPLHAELHWTTRGSMTFDATSILRRLDLPATSLAVPPASTTFAAGALPAQSAEILLSHAELGALRNGPTALSEPSPKAITDPHASLVLMNATDELRFAWLDGVPIAWVAPGGRAETGALFRGRYSLEWRTFLGDVATPTQIVTLPATSEVGALDN